MVLQMGTIHVLPFRIAIIVIGLDFHGFLCLTLSSHYHTIACDSYKQSLEQTTILRWVSKTRTLDLDHFNPAPSLPFQAQNLELFCLVRSGLIMIQHYRGSGLIGCRRSGWLMLIFFSFSLTSAFDICTWPACVLDVGDFSFAGYASTLAWLHLTTHWARLILFCCSWDFAGDPISTLSKWFGARQSGHSGDCNGLWGGV
jgi:hypothetical protein